MKKYRIYIGILVCILLAACDMDKYPYGSVNDKDYFNTFYHFQSARTGLYNTLRSTTTGPFRIATEIQGFAFNAKDGFNNNYGEDYMWNFQTSHGTGIFAGYYKQIKNSNYILTVGLPKFEENRNQFSFKEQQTISNYISEAYFIRAFSYYQLTQFFCQAYTPELAEKPATGMPLQLEYDPKMTASTWKGRSTLKETYEQILSDLGKAEKLCTEEGKIGNHYISKDAVKALYARVYLSMKDYDNAKKCAEELIESRTYELMPGHNLKSMWYDDAGTEAIWQITMPTKEELGSPDGILFNGNSRFDEMDYMPSQDLLSLYSGKDYRMSVYFERKYLKVNSGSAGNIYAFVKYNMDGKVFQNLKITDAKYVHEPQVFRISEMYLIAAEAEALGSKPNLNAATKYLNDFKKQRIESFSSHRFKTTDEFMTELKNERRREFVGEGFYLFDQKRWHEGVKRTAAQNPSLVFQPNSNQTVLLNVDADNYRMTWPIPKSEMDVNPQLKGQQNPGY